MLDMQVRGPEWNWGTPYGSCKINTEQPIEHVFCTIQQKNSVFFFLCVSVLKWVGIIEVVFLGTWSSELCEEKLRQDSWVVNPASVPFPGRFLLFGSLISSLCLSSVSLPPSFAVCSDPCSMSTFLILSPSLLQPGSLKIAALLNRLSLSFICHSPPPWSTLYMSLCVFF